MQNAKVYGYTLLHRLGVGGMAEVWYAENDIEKPAAVKILNEDLSHNAQIVERFRNEAKVTVKLNHPNIRQVYDFSAIDGRPCMVMEYLEGADLSARMKRGERFTDEQLRKWWNQLASALNYTHGEGVVHRDIKPSNIFVTDKGDVKLLDFGIAKVRDSITSTVTGAMMGTLMYMSPEQVRDSKHIDAKTDLYSLAVTFVHLLTGCAPYDRDTTDDYEIRKNIVETPLDLSGLSSTWQNLLKPYLAKNPADRPALRELPVGDGHGGFVPPVTPPASISEETVVGDAAAATRVMDEETVADVLQPTVNKKSNSVPAPQKSKKKRKGLIVGIIVAVLVLAGGVGAVLLLNEKVPVDQTMEYVDLGLPSGTLWRGMNEDGDKLYTYDEAMERFSDRLPTKEQLEELSDECKWTWTGRGYNVKGPNGNSIFLPAAGYRNCGDNVSHVGTYGSYWSSTPDGSERAWSLDFNSSGVRVNSDDRCYGLSVRLVQGK